MDRLKVFWYKKIRHRWCHLYQAIFEREYKDMALPVVTSVHEIETRLSGLEYTPDKLVDRSSRPAATWARNKDDCDGYAGLAGAWLKQLGKEPVLLTVICKPGRLSHQVCVFEDDGTSWFFDLDHLRHTEGGYERIVGILARHARKIICWYISDVSTLEIREFHEGGKHA